MEKECRKFIAKHYEDNDTVIIFKGKPCHLQEEFYDLLQTYDDRAILVRSSLANATLAVWRDRYQFPIGTVNNHNELVLYMIRHFDAIRMLLD